MTNACQSCSMPIESGDYCTYCVDSSGRLHSFDETLARMTQFAMRRLGVADPAAAKAQTLEFMATMPAWRDHPELARRRGG